MRTIWKFTFKLNSVVEVQMPDRARVIHVGEQNGLLCLWAMVDTENQLTARRFRIFGTGHPLSTDVKESHFIGTVFQSIYVWHVFEVPV